MTNRSHVTKAIVCVVTLISVGATWFALGQKTNDLNLPESMAMPLVRDVNMENKVEALARRIDALEATVGKLENEINKLQKAGNTRVVR